MNTILKAMIALAGAGLFAACSGSGGGGSTPAPAGPSTTLTISGALSSASPMNAFGVRPARDNASFAVSLGDLEIYAIAFTSPPVIARANVNATTGAFSVDLPGAKGSSVTAVFRDTTNNNEVGSIVFRDSSAKDLNGAAKDSSSVVLNDTVSLGNLSIGDDGKVVVDVAAIQTVVAAPASSGTAFDMSGIWKASTFANPPTGYVTTCAAGSSMNDCNSLPEGTDIGLIRIAGKLFTPSGAGGTCNIDAGTVACAATDGTVGTADRFALGVWDAAGVAACGHKTGFTEDEARAGGLIHITGALPTIGGTQLTFGDYSGYNPYFWVKAAATATRDIYDCSGSSITIGGKSVPTYMCKGNILLNSNQSDTGNDGWQVNLGNGGCFDSSNKPVRMTNWGSASPTSCTDSSAGLPTGFKSGTCVYENVDPDGSGPNYPSPINFSCRWTHGAFADLNGAPDLNTPIDQMTYQVGPPTATVTSGSPCGNQADGVGTGLTLNEAQCYGNYYEMNRNTISTDCGPRPRFNWGASTVENFYRVDYRGKPDQQFLMDILTYDASGNLATLDTEEKETFTIPSGSNSSVTCEMARKIVFNVKKITDTTGIVDIRFSGRMASTAAACQSIAKVALENIEFNKTAAENDRRRAIDGADLEHNLRPQAMIFNMTKQ